MITLGTMDQERVISRVQNTFQRVVEHVVFKKMKRLQISLCLILKDLDASYIYELDIVGNILLGTEVDDGLDVELGEEREVLLIGIP